jgi:hypothetical protein
MTTADIFECILKTYHLPGVSNKTLGNLASVCKDSAKATRAILAARCIVYNPRDERRFCALAVRRMREYQDNVFKRAVGYMKDIVPSTGKVTRTYPERKTDVEAYAFTIVDPERKTMCYLEIERVRGFALKLKLYNFDTNAAKHVKVENGKNYVLFRRALDREVTIYPTNDTDGVYVAVDDGMNAVYRLDYGGFTSMFKAMLRSTTYPLAQIM